MNEKGLALKVGLFSFLAIAVFTFLITWKGGLVVKVQGYELIGRFSNIGGLLETADVRFRGYKVGEVIRIKQSGDFIDVYIKISRSIKVPEGSRMRIEFDGLIGSKYVGILPADDIGVYLKPDSVMSGFKTHGLVDFVDSGTQTLEEARMILAAIRVVVADPAVGNSLKGALGNFENISIHIGEMIPEITKTINDLDQVIMDVEGIFEDGQFDKNINATVENFNEMANDLKIVALGFKQIMSSPGTTDNIKNIIEKLNNISNEVNDIVVDKKLKKDITKTLKSARGLAETLSEFELTSSVQVLQTNFQKATTGKDQITGRLNTTLKLNPKTQFSLGIGETFSFILLLSFSRNKFLNHWIG